MTKVTDAKKKRLKLLESLAAKARPEYFVPTINRLRKDLNHAESSDTIRPEEEEFNRRESERVEALRRKAGKIFSGGSEVKEA